MGKQKANYNAKHFGSKGGRSMIVNGNQRKPEHKPTRREMSDTDKMTSRVIWALIGIAALWAVFA